MRNTGGVKGVTGQHWIEDPVRLESATLDLPACKALAQASRHTILPLQTGPSLVL